MSGRPWTPGPWRAKDHCLLNGRRNDADADLIALAPEMAAALLSLEDYHDCPAAVTEDAARSVCEVVEKLRAIGGEA